MNEMIPDGLIKYDANMSQKLKPTSIALPNSQVDELEH